MNHSVSPPPEAWTPAHRAAQKLAAPIYRFFGLETASGLLLMFAVVVALVWANSPWHASYQGLWHTNVGLELGSWSMNKPLHFWFNEGLMTIFFLSVGLEIRRELYEGELASLRQAALPVAAAIGGVLLPALLFVALNHGRAGAGGWAIPMATDIAFALGVLTLLGSRVPGPSRVLLLGLAVIDDIIAIIVIAVFFAGGISMLGFAVAAGGLAGAWLLRSAGVRSSAVFIIPGAFVWFGLYAAGVHPTLAGVLLGLLAPVRPWFGPAGFEATTQSQLDGLVDAERHDLLGRLDEIERARREAISPAERLIHVLHPWVAYVVMPGFAFANAGVALGGASLAGDSLWLFLGIVVGLVIGKPVGITGAALASFRLGTIRSEELTPRNIVLVGAVGGIGFTMSLFIAQLAFENGPMLSTAKIAILTGSMLASVFGLGYGRFWLRR